MELNSSIENKLHIVEVNEQRIDASVALTFKELMRQETDNGHDLIILDMQQVQFVDSSGLGAIVASMKALGAGRKLVLAGMTPTVDKVFRLTRMDSVFSIFQDLEDAKSEYAP